MLESRPLHLIALTLALSGLVVPAAAALAGDSPFRDLTGEALDGLPPRGEWESPLPRRFRALEVDWAALEALLAQAPAERSAAALTTPLLVALPWPDGTDRLFRVEESSILEPALAAKFPDIHTFVAQGIDDPTATARLSLTAMGFHAMVLSTAGTVFIDPYRRWDGEHVLSYFKSEARRHPGDAFRCEVTDDGGGEADGNDGIDAGGDAANDATPQSDTPSGSTLRTYRLALAATGEYTTRVCLPTRRRSPAP